MVIGAGEGDEKDSAGEGVVEIGMTALLDLSQTP